MPGDIISLISSVNPTVNEIVSLFKGFSKMSPSMYQFLLKAIDEHLLEKIAQWSQVFIKHVNDLGPDAILPYVLDDAEKPVSSDDFMSVMKDAEYRGPKLSASDLQEVSNAVTKAIKANDWEQAVQVGIGIAKFI